MNDLYRVVETWIADDPDETDREEMRLILARAKVGDRRASDDLADRFSGPIAFGTAGLRGRLGAGPNRMNTAVVTTATAGLASFLGNRLDVFKVVIGYDGRHRSAALAKTAAGVLTAAGAEVLVMPRLLPTPVLAYSVLALDADAGIMITASHNPPDDNGYKVFLGGRVSDAAGAQLVSPTDTLILSEIQAAGPASRIPVVGSGWKEVPEAIVDDYVADAAALSSPRTPKNIRIAVTAMHGVGADTARRVFSRAGFTDVHLVASQAEPDPDFPTIAFPNPEEPGALDEAIRAANEVSADLIVALDPDADRCSVAIGDPQSPGGWRQLSGDELGSLLGEQAAVEHAGDSTAVLVRSIVSSTLLARIADAHGVSTEETLTGFKWISRVEGMVYGYEEAIGYCVNPRRVRDKDGITAGLKTIELAAGLKARGRTLADALTDQAVAYGLYATSPMTFRVDDIGLISKGMTNLRSRRPESLAGSALVDFDDLAQGWQGLPATDGMRLRTERGDRVVVRPSGTEPKLKCYLEVIEAVDGPESVSAARSAAHARLDTIKQEIASILGLG